MILHVQWVLYQIMLIFMTIVNHQLACFKEKSPYWDCHLSSAYTKPYIYQNKNNNNKTNASHTCIIKAMNGQNKMKNKHICIGNILMQYFDTTTNTKRYKIK